MTSRISHTSVDARNAYAQSVWWGQVLGWSEDPEDPNEPGHEECLLFAPEGRSRLLFIQQGGDPPHPPGKTTIEVPEPKSTKNRLHLDLRPVEGTRDDEVARLLALGATQVGDHRRPDGGGWATLADPEGTVFCVLRGDAEAPDPHAHLVTPLR
ncbi:VOC family protein [uncultured Friedmanniella sp.]|uniref:VOC family protein n=1 Tax=uncultured Friedmanniella sp. TaxID=335381 RepID=UPI0035CC04C2